MIAIAEWYLLEQKLRGADQVWCHKSRVSHVIAYLRSHGHNHKVLGSPYFIDVDTFYAVNSKAIFGTW